MSKLFKAKVSGGLISLGESSSFFLEPICFEDKSPEMATTGKDDLPFIGGTHLDFTTAISVLSSVLTIFLYWMNNLFADSILLTNYIQFVESELNKKIGHLSESEIRRRCKCIVKGTVYTYTLDCIPILTFDFRPRPG